MDSPSSRHPVWDVYDEFRTMVFRLDVYTKKIRSWRRVQLIMEVVIALFTPSSAIAWIFFRDTYWGDIAWHAFIIIASVAAITKPLIRIEDRIQLFQKNHGIYKDLYHDLDDLKTLVSQSREYSEAMKNTFLGIRNKKRQLAQAASSYHLSKRLKYQIFEDVNRQYPPHSFFVPSTENTVRDEQIS